MSLELQRLSGDVRAQKRVAIDTKETHLVNWGYLITGLCGEVGEFAGEVKKNVRNGAEIDLDAAKDELADVLWYVEACAQKLGTNLDELAQIVVTKLQKRRRTHGVKSL